jgi:hypothetical protein
VRVRISLILWSCLALVASGACQSPESAKRKGQVDPEPKTELKALDDDAAAAEMPHVNFKIDGKKLLPIKLSEETVVLSLKSLPPIEEWKMMIVRNIEGREFRATRPALLTGDRTMKIVKLEDQSYEFRVMERSDKEETIRHRMSKVKVVEIQTHSYTPPRATKVSPVIRVTGKGKTRALDKAALDAIARTPEPGSEKNRDTWLLLDLVGEKSLAPSRSIVLRKSGEGELVLTGEMVADKNAMHIVKRNRRGQFNYRGWTLGEAPAKTSELRGIIEIEVR